LKSDGSFSGLAESNTAQTKTRWNLLAPPDISLTT
jgi:hypothetical protein